MQLRGWVELDGRRLIAEELERLLSSGDPAICRLGGEFCITWRECAVRDHFGIIPGPIPPGTLFCAGERRCNVAPMAAGMPLDRAIAKAVELRRDEGIVALSGGVDSALIAAIAGLPALVVGTEGCQDHAIARRVAEALHLRLEVMTVTVDGAREALEEVVALFPGCSALDAGIAATLYLVAGASASLGHSRVLTGQGADELFAGYARHLRSTDLESDLRHDLESLRTQIARDQAVAAHFGVYFSLPYMDCRVVAAARSIPAEAKIVSGVRKSPLRQVAERYLGREFAYREKKAMQYGSGIWGCLKRIACQEGFRNIGGYLGYLKAKMAS
ncbi:MAG: asparagine synthase C-terminal domain-containing protein [Methanomicrobiales archaeon]|nr:asparagine synthase C-terminal domain-containing protein [Methanomicrobiales archaeon]